MRNLIIILGIFLISGCVSTETTQGRRERLYKDVDYQSFAWIAVINPPRTKHVTMLLEKNDIPNMVKGRVTCAVSVPKELKIKAIEILKADAAKEHYYIKF